MKTGRERKLKRKRRHSYGFFSEVNIGGILKNIYGYDSKNYRRKQKRYFNEQNLIWEKLPSKDWSSEAPRK